MKIMLDTIKGYVSTTTFLLLSALVYIFSDKNAFAQKVFELVLPDNGKPLAFCTFLGLIFLYEITIKNQKILKDVFEKGQLISDVNSAFTEFQNSGKANITGEYYIKEIMSLEDRRKRLKVNSYTQNKLQYLIDKIAHKGDK